jgi:NADH dehydrogenase FAD-containing subunit
MAGKRLVLVGGGHAHLTTLLRAGDITGAGHIVTLVSSHSYHYYSGMGPGMLSGIYRQEEVRFNIRKMAEDRDVEFIEDTVERVEPGGRRLSLASGRELPYDVVSFNTGSDIPVEKISISGGRVYTVKPIINLLKAREDITGWPAERPLNIAIAGGGPAGVEVAGNALRLMEKAGLINGAGNKKGRLALIAGGGLLRGFPRKARLLARASLEKRGAVVIEGQRISEVLDGEVILSNGVRVEADITIIATGVRPSGIFRASGLPVDGKGGMLVNRRLQCVAHAEILGGGDCISLEGSPLAKVGVYAVRENPVLMHNIIAALSGSSPVEFDPGGKYLLVLNLGDGRGVLWKGPVVMGGRAAFKIKDYIDRRFMRKFQVSGEPGEAGNQ